MRRSKEAFSLVALLLVLTAGCGAAAPPLPRIEDDSDLAVLQQAVQWPNRAPSTVTTLMSLYAALGREGDGHRFFATLSQAEPDDGVLLAGSAVLRVQMSREIPLIDRAGWVETGLAELDRAVELDPNLPRFLRAIIFARVPSRFDRATRAVEELQWLLESPESFLRSERITSTTRLGLERQARQALAQAYETLGDAERAEEAWRRAGGRAIGAGAPLLATPYSVDGVEGFRFSNRSLWRPAPGVIVARGFDFGEIAFVETDAGLLVIDAGTTVENARAALEAVRAEVGALPIHTVVLTHAHWDHVGGLEALREPGTRVIAQSRFASELARVNAAGRDYGWFFGRGLNDRPRDEPLFRVEPDVLVDADMTLSIGGREVRLHAAPGGETEDALLVELPDAGILFVGDAFMPYVGSPFVGEGLPDGFVAMIEQLEALSPRLLVHGHPALTDLYVVDNLAPVRESLLAFRTAVERGVRNGVPLAEIVSTTLLPDLLADHPEAVLPVFVLRQTYMQRLHRELTGYWQPDLEGLEVITSTSWSLALDLLAEGDEARWVRALEQLVSRGDYAVAWRLAERGLEVHGGSPEIDRLRVAALHGLRRRYQQTSPFKLIVYSQQADAPIAPLP